MMGYFSVKDFERHQHYKDRRPPWIKLYNDLLSDYEFCQLPDASKMHLVAIWLLASRYENRVPADAEWIAKQISASEKVDLEILAEAGFIVFDQSCSKTLADCKQNAMPEKETETETEEETDKVPTEPLSAKADETDEVYELWNEVAGEFDLPKARRTNGPTLKHVQNRLRDHGLDGWQNAINGIRGSPHHRGENDRGWRADLPWLSLPSNFEKLMMKGETYGDRGSPGRKANTNSGLGSHMGAMARIAGKARSRRGDSPEAVRVGTGTSGEPDASAVRESEPGGETEIEGTFRVLPSSGSG